MPSHNVDEFLGQLEIGTLETHVFARGPIENETEIDVDDVTPIIYHDVSIVSVLNLQDVADNGVCRKGFDKVKPCKFELTAMLTPKSLQEILVQIYLKRLSKLVSRVRIGHALDNSS